MMYHQCFRRGSLVYRLHNFIIQHYVSQNVKQYVQEVPAVNKSEFNIITGVIRSLKSEMALFTSLIQLGLMYKQLITKTNIHVDLKQQELKILKIFSEFYRAMSPSLFNRSYQPNQTTNVCHDVSPVLQTWFTSLSST